MRNLMISFHLPAVLLGLSLSSCAMAQQQPARQEEDRASSNTTSQSFAYQITDGDDRSIELRIENGRVVTAKVNGESIPADRVKKVRDGYDLLAEDGSLIKHVAVMQAGATQGMGSARGGASASSGGRARSRARIAISPDSHDVQIRELDPIEVQGFEIDTSGFPKSMIGAGLGVPDQALVHHLKIDRAKSTVITSVVEGLPAQAAGLEQFDVIVSVNGDRDASSDHLRSVLRDAEPGSKIVLEIVRGSETRKVEVAAVAFDGDKLESIEPDPVQGFAIPPMGSFGGEAGEGGVMFFVGPDGQRRELRMPAMPGVPSMQGEFEPERMAEFQRAMEGFNQRMEEWSRRMEQRMHEDGVDGDVEFDVDVRPAPGMPGAGRPRDNAPPNAREGGNDERMRRLEQRLDQLMRELERQRAENRDRKSDA